MEWLDRQVQWVPPAPQDQWEQSARWDRRATKVRLDPEARLELTVARVCPDPREPWDHPVYLGPLVRWAARDHAVKGEAVDPAESVDPPVLLEALDPLVNADLLVIQAWMDVLDHAVKRVQRVHKDLWARLAAEVTVEQLDVLVPKDARVQLVIKEQLDLLVLAALLDPKARKGRRDVMVIKEKLVSGVTADLWELLVQRVCVVSPAHLAFQEPLVWTVVQEPMVPQANPVRRVNPVFQVQPVRWAVLAWTVCLVPGAKWEPTVSTEQVDRRVHRDRRVLLAAQEVLENQVPQALQAQWVHQAPQVQLASLVQLESKAQRELVDSRARMEMLVSPVSLELQVLMVFQAPLELRVPLASLVQQATKDLLAVQALKAMLVHLVLMVSLVKTANRDLVERMERLALPASKARLDRPALVVFAVNAALPVKRE